LEQEKRVKAAVPLVSGSRVKFPRLPTFQCLKAFFSAGIVCTGMFREEPNSLRGAKARS